MRDPVFIDAEVLRLQALDVVVLAVGYLVAQHYHVHLDAKDGPLRLRAQQQTAGRYSE